MQTPSEKCARAFLAHARHEKGRATRCLDQIFDLIMCGDEALTDREQRIAEAIIAYTRRDDELQPTYVK